MLNFDELKTFLSIRAVMSQTATYAEMEAMCIVDLVQVLGECNPNAPTKYQDQVKERKKDLFRLAAKDSPRKPL